SQLAWVDRSGREEPIAAPSRAYVIPRISPDGTRLAIQIGDQERDIWTWDVARHVRSGARRAAGLDARWAPHPVLVAAWRRVQHVLACRGRHGRRRAPDDGREPALRE